MAKKKLELTESEKINAIRQRITYSKKLDADYLAKFLYEHLSND